MVGVRVPLVKYGRVGVAVQLFASYMFDYTHVEV